MFKCLGNIIEDRPVISSITLTVLVSAISVLIFDIYRDWRDSAVPIVNLSDIRISPESNKYFLKEDDLIPTSIELMEYLRGDVRTGFIGLQKVTTYKKYYNYLNQNRKNIIVFDSEKKQFMDSLLNILQLLKIKNPTEKDKEKFFDIVWRNYGRIWGSFDVLISSGLINIAYFEKSHDSDKEKADKTTFVFQKVLISRDSSKEKYILRKRKGSIEYISSGQDSDWDDLRRENEIKFYKAIESFNQNVLISIFEKILDRYENKLLSDSLKKIEYEIDQISRWEVDVLISNRGKRTFGILPYAFLVVETKQPSKEYQSYRIPLEYRIDYNTLRTLLLPGDNSSRITFLSKERIGENNDNKKWYAHYISRNSQCKIEIYTTLESGPIFSEYVSFEPSKV